jgi:DNA repair protein RecN (Recombination protein N)
VLCITHLPQVAAYGTTHYRVSKLVENGRTVTRVDRLKEQDRIEEIARMMGGREVSASVRAGAQDMIASRARARRPSKAKGESERRKFTA